MMRRLTFFLLLLTAAGLERAHAANCSVTINSPLNFGTYTGTQIRMTTTAQVTCPGGSWDMPLDAGTGSGATTTTRKLTGPNGATLNYQIFRDSAYTQNWGNTASDELSGSGSQTVYIYAQLAAGQTGPAGTYTDTVDSATKTLTLTAVIVANCSISANALAFGSYAGATVNASTTLSVTCTNGTAYNVGLNAGASSGATVTTRAMTGPGSATLSYALYSNSGRTTNWGNSTGSWVSGTGTGSAQTSTVYGQIPAGQYPTPGAYADTITATVNY